MSIQDMVLIAALVLVIAIAAIVLVTLIVARGLAAGARAAAPAIAAAQRTSTLWRWSIFAYDIAVVVVLTFLLVSYFMADAAWSVHKFVPDPLRGVGLRAAWLGALGGMVISLKGVYDHDVRTWEHRFNAWHLGRPISGAIAGGITWVLLQALGSNPSPTIVEAAAFIMGTQEARFFQFLSEVARVIVTVPATPGPPLTITSVNPARAQPGTTVTLIGTGFDPVNVFLVHGAAMYRLDNLMIAAEGDSVSATVPVIDQGTSNNPYDVLVVNKKGQAFQTSGAFSYQSRLALDQDELDFGQVQAGQARDLVLRATNSSQTLPAQIRNLAIAEEAVAGTFEVDALVYPYALAAGANVGVTVRLTANAQPGNPTARLVVTTEDGECRVPLRAQVNQPA